MQHDDPLAAYTPGWRERVGQQTDPLAGYSPEWRERQASAQPSQPERPPLFKRVTARLRAPLGGSREELPIVSDLAADATRFTRPPDPLPERPRSVAEIEREQIRANRGNTVTLRTATIDRTPAVAVSEEERGEHMRALVERGREANRTLGLREPRLGDVPAPGVELTGALREDLPIGTELVRTAKRFGGQVLV